MSYRIALLLNKPENSYQQALAEDAQRAAERHGFDLLPPSFANGSAVEQVAAMFTYHRQKVSGYLIYPVVPDMLTSVAETLVAGGASLAFLTRAPYQIARIRQCNSAVLVTSVPPDQREIGALQGEQCRRLLPQGGSVVLIEGPVESPVTHERRAGLLEALGTNFRVQSLEGRWEPQEAERVLTAWLASAGRTLPKVDIVVCQNDAMASGARLALDKAAERLAQPRLRSLPLMGIDAVPGDGQKRVLSGELTATVENPRTSGPAIDLLARFWKHGERTEQLLLKAHSIPPLEQLRPVPKSS